MAAYTNEEQVTRLWDTEDVKDLMARRCYYKQSDRREEELQQLWVQDPELQKTASLANNLGYFVGMDDIRNYYVTGIQARRQEQLAAVQQAFPEAQYGAGVMNAHTYHTVMVELAADGKTARYLAYDHGTQTDPQPDGSAKGYFTSGHMLADLVKENGSWKIWHIKAMHDWTIPAEGVPGAGGFGFGGPPPEDAEGGAPGGPDDGPGEPGGPGGPPPQPDMGPDPFEDDYGTPTVALPYRAQYGWNDLPKQMPNTYAPHETYDPSVSYGPDGHPSRLRSWR